MTNCRFKDENDVTIEVEKVFREVGIDLVIFSTIKGSFNYDPRRHCLDLYTFSKQFKIIVDKK